jgi:hypothetical protein
MAGIPATGTSLKRGGTAGTAVANVTSIEGPGLDSDVIDVSAHDSASAFRDKVIGLLDAGEITLRLNFDPANATHKDAAGGLLNDYRTRTSQTWALVFPTTPAVNWTFTAYVKAFNPSLPHDDKAEASATLVITGAPTLA